VEQDSGGEEVVKTGLLRCKHGKRPDEPCLECGSVQRRFYGPSRVWAEKMVREGRCKACGRKRGDSPYKKHCEKCGQKPALWKRKREGREKRQPGGRGRPILAQEKS
jgi:hypothetical protein